VADKLVTLALMKVTLKVLLGRQVVGLPAGLDFNSTQLKYRGKKLESLYKSRSLRKQSILFLNNSHVPQLINHTGKLFHASITLIVKRNISWHLNRPEV